METTTKRKLPRIARVVKSYLRLVDPATAGTIEFMERSKLKGECIRRMRTELDRLERRRRASTLTEVLVALMIASIGLVSVATLFPLSIMRSIKATQLTSATDARFNAETAIDIYPAMLSNPVAPSYSIAKLANSEATDPPITQNYIIDPLGFSALASLNSGNGLTSPGSSATLYQNRYEHWFGNDASNGVALNAGTSQWPLNPPGVPWVDNTPVPAPSFGIARYPMTWRPSPVTAGVPIPVIPSLAAARYLVTLPDSWLLQFDTVGGTFGTDNNAPAPPASSRVTQITINGLSYPTSTPPSPALRIVMFSADGLSSQIRNVTAINGNTVIWTEDIDGSGPSPITAAGTDPRDVNGNRNLDHYPLPQSFVNQGIGIVRLEAQDPRYTWLLTMRQPNPATIPATASVDVVVFFNRSIENIAVDEVLYQAAFSLGSTQVQVTYPTGNNTTTNQPLKPFMKKGGFIFDANNAYWYRISNVVDGVAGTSTITLEAPANASNTNITNINTGNLVPPRAMFPRNIVDVFPLGSKP